MDVYMDRVPLAMTSFSNSGKALITAWQIPGTAIYYKLTGSGTEFRPAPSGIGASATKQSSVYPNPAHNQLTIQAVAKGAYTITNSIGQSLLSGNINEKQTRIDIYALSPGMYWLSLRSGAQIQHLKFIKL